MLAAPVQSHYENDGPGVPIDARTILGVPFIPPASMSEGGARVRSALGRLHRAMAPPPVQILESALALLDHRVLVALCEAGVPDALDHPMTVEQLASALSVDPTRLDRLVRFASARGWVRIDRRGRVHATRTTRFLRADHPAGWRSWVDFMSIDHVVGAVAALDVYSTDDAFESANGQPFFSWMATHPAAWSTFDRAMAAGGRMHALTLDAAIDWAGVGSICDVGGGTGDLLAALLDRHPTWRGAVFDLPDVVARSIEHPRLQAIGGDAFVDAPAGFDAYLLVNVLHDWNDTDAGRILCRVGRAAPLDARIFVVDSNRRAVPRDELGLRADVLMAALTNGGHERDTAAFAELGRGCGLRLVRTVRLASGDLAHELRHQS
jgi:O-methyltransferase domain